MPTNCCVLLCTKKDKRDNQMDKKISFFCFPKEENLKKQWIHVIRRDVGPNFSINNGTWVCSRHFREEDLQMGLSGKVSPRTGAVPSIFCMKFALEMSTADTMLYSYNIGKIAAKLKLIELIETGEVKNITMDCECSTDFVKRSEKDILIADLNKKPSAALANEEESEPGPVVSKLKEKVVDLERKYEKLEERLFSFKNIVSNDSLVAFYTGFPKYQTMMALYDFLNPGEHGENIIGCREKMLIVPPSL